MRVGSVRDALPRNSRRASSIIYAESSTPFFQWSMLFIAALRMRRYQCRTRRVWSARLRLSASGCCASCVLLLPVGGVDDEQEEDEGNVEEVEDEDETILLAEEKR